MRFIVKLSSKTNSIALARMAVEIIFLASTTTDCLVALLARKILQRTAGIASKKIIMNRLYDLI